MSVVARKSALIGTVPSPPAPFAAASPGITHGIQLIAPFAGSPSSSLVLSTNVSPNALLQSPAYPLPSNTSGSGPLTTAAAPTGADTTWRMFPGDEGTGSTALTAQWQNGPTTTYVYNDNPANLGGITAAPMVIDGYSYPAGTYVFQFLDFSQLGYQIGFFATWYTTVLRGCRSRNELDAPGFINMQGFTNYLGLHYCDIGCKSAAFCATQLATVSIDLSGFGGSSRVLRCYTSYGSTGIQPNCAAQCETIENYVEKLTFSDVGSPPVPAHLNGICLNGSNPQWYCARNNVVIATPDENGATVDQTDCIALFQDFGTFPGTGTNYNGTLGYQITGNYLGGTGYSLYLGQNEGTEPDTVNNVDFTGNLLTTSQWATGGAIGPVAAIPTWGSTYGNSYTSDLWADGTAAGLSLISPSYVGVANVEDTVASPGPTISYSSTAGNTLILSGYVETGSTAVSGISSITDSAGNPWQYSTSNAQNPPSQASSSGGTHYAAFVAWCIGAAAITSVTVHDSTGHSDFWNVFVSEWAGITAARTGAAAAGSATDPSTPALSPGSGDLIIVAQDSVAGVTLGPSQALAEFGDDAANTYGTAWVFAPWVVPPYEWGFSSSGTADYAFAVMAFAT